MPSVFYSVNGCTSVVLQDACHYEVVLLFKFKHFLHFFQYVGLFAATADDGDFSFLAGLDKGVHACLHQSGIVGLECIACGMHLADK